MLGGRKGGAGLFKIVEVVTSMQQMEMVKNQIAGRKRNKKRDSAQVRRVTQLADAIDVSMPSQAIPSETTEAIEAVREASLACEQRDMKDLHDKKRQIRDAMKFMEDTLAEAALSNTTTLSNTTALID